MPDNHQNDTGLQTIRDVSDDLRWQFDAGLDILISECGAAGLSNETMRNLLLHYAEQLPSADP
jgi:hypothetical protein